MLRINNSIRTRKHIYFVLWGSTTEREPTDNSENLFKPRR